MGRAGAKGGLWERSILDWLRKDGYDAERLRLAGKEDEGDLVVKDGQAQYIIEAKDVARWSLPDWWRQAVVERDNYAKHRGLDPANLTPLVVVKHRGKGTGQGWVITSMEEFFV
ncbi:hypothetical protein [Kineococcus sp. NPDC059986]|uniref:hypothetical protein n=1 Tax=Actinomycetes TaxID=1760 RepID=UPI00344C240E